MSVDEIDTILLLRTYMMVNRLGMKANFTAKLTQIDKDKQG